MNQQHERAQVNDVMKISSVQHTFEESEQSNTPAFKHTDEALTFKPMQDVRTRQLDGRTTVEHL
jgi:hypothetical protein